jgi:DNA-binding MarR family transcriptional regulator
MIQNDSVHPQSSAFLLAQLGAYAARRFAERLAKLELAPPHAGILRAIARRPPMNQRTLADLLSIQPAKLVELLDELEKKGLVDRTDHPEDRRSYALRLTAKGVRMLESIGIVARDHDDEICKGLDRDERRALHDLLVKLAERAGLAPGVHPGFRNLRK